MPQKLIARREFVRTSIGTLGALAAGAAVSRGAPAPSAGPEAPAARGPDSIYTGEHLDQIAFPMGGMGAGMICLEGSGALTNVSVRHQPQVQNEPGLLAAISIGGPEKVARVIEGPVPKWKLYERRHASAGSAPMGMGLPRFEKATFRPSFPSPASSCRTRPCPSRRGSPGGVPLSREIPTTPACPSPASSTPSPTSGRR